MQSVTQSDITARPRNMHHFQKKMCSDKVNLWKVHTKNLNNADFFKALKRMKDLILSYYYSGIPKIVQFKGLLYYSMYLFPNMYYQKINSKRSKKLSAG